MVNVAVDAAVVSHRDALLVVIEDQIVPADVEAIRRIEHPVVNVLLNSEGGYVDAAMEMGQHIRDKRWSVSVEPGAVCYSSCALLYIAGTSRHSLGEIGLHRPYFAGPPHAPDAIRSGLPKMLADVRSYIEAMGVTQEFADIMINTPPERMSVFIGEDIERLVPAEDPLHDELRIASMARVRGVTTEEYRWREVEMNRKCGPFARDVSLYFPCAQATSWGLSVPVYQQRAALVQERCSLSDEQDAEIDSWGDRWAEHPANLKWERCQREVMSGSR